MTKILLVEDDKSLREIYGVRLLAEGYDIVSAGDGEEALAMAIKERPHLIISDVMMPKISGFDMLDILRSTTETKDIKVIMMTALSSEEQRQRGEALGADKYLVKSQVGIEDVVRVVHEVLDDQPTTNGGGNFSANDFAAPQPAASVAPQPAAAPQAAAPAPSPVPAPAVTPQTVAAPASPVAPAAAPQPVAPPVTPPSTAAYDTPRPVGSSERIIQPLPSAENPSAPPDINALLDKELAAEASASSPAPAQEPTVAAPPDPTYALSPELQQQLNTAAQPAVPATPAAAPQPTVAPTTNESTPPAGSAPQA